MPETDDRLAGDTGNTGNTGDADDTMVTDMMPSHCHQHCHQHCQHCHTLISGWSLVCNLFKQTSAVFD